MNKMFITLKKGFLLFLFLILSQSIFSQQLEKNQQNNQPANFYEIQKKFNDYWEPYNVQAGYYIEDGVKKKAPNWKLFKRWEYYWEQRVNLTTGEFPQTNSIDEYLKYKNSHPNLKKENSFNENWTNLGTNSSAGGYAGIGRINCIAFHPTDPNTFWVGTPSSGIWKTVDGGSNWAIINSSLNVLGVSAIVVDPTNTDIIYIATGDRDGGSMYTLSGGQGADNASIGVYKTVNGGTSWSATGLTYTTSQKKKTYDLIMDPTNHLKLLASTTDGIYWTANGGSTWTKGITSDKSWRIAFKPGDPSIVYGIQTYTGAQYFQRSLDGGVTWPNTEDFTIVGGGGYRTEMAVSPAEPNTVYLVTAKYSDQSLLGIYKSTSSGANGSWSQVFSPTTVNLLGYNHDGSDLTSGQGAYDLCIAVNPENANEIYVGGVNTWKSINGGTSWSNVTMWSGSYGVPVVHADKHALAFQSGSILYEGNDGGIYKVTNSGATYEDKSNGLVISQIYRIGVSQTVSTKTITGLQDNGSKLFNSGSWSDVTGGDGMECIIDYSNANYMYATYTEGQISRSINGSTFQSGYITANIPGGQPKGAWVTPYVIDPNNSQTLFAGFKQVWKTTDRGDSWTSASQQLSASTKLRSLAIAPSNSNILYAADQTNMWKTTDGGATNWTSVTLPSLSSNSITYIAVHASDPNKVWFTVGGYTSGKKVFESTNGGTIWTNISTGLPNLPVMSIVHYKTPTDRDVLFVGTDLGVYVKDGTNNWAAYNTGLPNVVVSELDIYYSGGGTDKLRAGTFGRGLWETDIAAPLPVELTSFTANIVDDEVRLNWKTATEVNNYGFQIERTVFNSDDWQNIGFVEGHGNSNSPKQYSFRDKNPVGSNKFSYRLKQIDNDGKFEYSDVVEVELIPTRISLNQNYPNPFNPNTTISYSLPSKALVSLNVYNILGQETIKLVNEVKEVGSYNVNFEANNLPSGVYYYTLRAGNFIQTRKMILLK